MIITPDVSQVPLVIPKKEPKEMLTITESNGTTKVRINYSSLSIIQTCARKAFYKLDQGLVGENESPATLFGSAIHKALEIFYSEPRENRNIPPGFKEAAAMMAYGHQAPSDHFLYRAILGFVEKAQPLQALPETDKRSIANGIWILTHYFETYIDDPFEVLIDESGPITERQCEMVLHTEPGLEITLFGTVDVILKNMRTNVTLACDHKTSSVVGPDFYNRLKPNHQYTGYMLLARECLGIQGDGFLVNCVQVKPKPLTARGTPPHFPRQVTSRSEHDIEEFKQALVGGVKDYLRWKETGVWPLGNVDSCSFWGGCEFLPVCSAPVEVRQSILDNKYKTKGQ